MTKKKQQSTNPQDAQLDELTHKVSHLEQIVEDVQDKYMRARADYQNLERRMQEERSALFTSTRAEILSAFLPVLENLDKAEMFVQDPGLKMIKDQFIGVLEQQGVEEVPLLGQEFDPMVAECIEVADGEQDNIITKVSRKAFRLNGKVIQHGMVTVSKKNA